MVQADYLFLMTDVDGLYTKNPRNHVDAEVIDVVDDISTISADVSSAGSSLGTGGMSSKLVAARLATSAGVTTVITRSSKPGNVSEIVSYVQALKAVTSDPSYVPGTPLSEQKSSLSAIIESLPIPPRHTRFLPDPYPIRDRRFWLLHGLAPYGTIYIDEGAHHALMNKAGLLPVGVVDVEGHFAQQEAVRIVVVRRLHSKPLANGSPNLDGGIDPEGTGTSGHPLYEKTSPKAIEVGRALVNYSATEIARIKGLRSSEIEGVLGYADSEYVALRENVSLVTKRSGTGSGNITPTRVDSSSSSRVNLVPASGDVV